MVFLWQFARRPRSTLLAIYMVFSSAGATILLPRACGTELSAVTTFVTDNCLDCHSGSGAEGELDLESLLNQSNPFSVNKRLDEDTFRQWVRVVDRVAGGEMPPADWGDVSGDRDRFVDRTSYWLQKLQSAEHAELGRVRSRRLTNLQLENSLHDLLGIDTPLASLLPDEVRANGFNNLAKAQSISHFQLEDHLTVVDAALDAAFDRALAFEQSTFVKSYSPRQIARSNPKRRCREPEMRDGLAVVWNGTVSYYGRIASTTVRRSGWYRVAFDASALKPPASRGVWCSIRSGRCSSGAPRMTWIGSFEATSEAQTFSFEAWIPEGHMLEIRPADATLKVARFRGGQVGTGEGEPQNVPGLALHQLTIEEIHPGGTAGETWQKLFGQLPREAVQSEASSLAPEAAAALLSSPLEDFAYRAFRRPVAPEQLAPYQQLLEESLLAGLSPVESLRAAYRAVLCSPRFLYFVEPPGPLDDFAIASRLSYLIWASLPDQALLGEAAAGRLSKPEQIRGQAERLLQDPRGDQFVARFASQWLDLADIDFTEPDRKQFSDFDTVVQNSMLRETHLFLLALLDENRPAHELVTAQFTFLNSRLARYYGLPDVSGGAMRRVAIAEDVPRGGLLGQGAILKVTANGTNTSPVVRGVWVSQRLLGVEIPPPPASVPAIEPDIRGATTIREILAKHKADESCASCHRLIDPPGNALENFDAAGRWRDTYAQVKKSMSREALAVVPGDQMPDGRDFESFNEFRELWKQTPEPLARGFAQQLLTYATGAEITFADRESIDEIVRSTQADQYGLRSILHAALTSPIFLNK